MNLQQFKESMKDSQPAKEWSVYMKALWYDSKGQWREAHDLVDHLDGREAAHVHAYLHRVEGDHGNARYWYSRAGLPYCSDSLEQEWLQLFDKFND